MASNKASSGPCPLQWASVSDIGRVRQENQDACYADAESGLFLTCDGMGGHQAGAMASKIVTEIMPEMIRRRLHRLGAARARAIRYWLRSDILDLSKRLRAESAAQAELAGMGTTLVMVLLREDRAHIASMGDSRAYLFRDGQLTQLTEDHSLVGLLLRSGEITPEEAKDHPARGQLTRYIGMKDEVYPDVRTVDLAEGDRLLLCSDGLTGVISDQTIAEILKAQDDSQAACQTLVDAANAAGGPDNVTVVIVDWQGCADQIVPICESRRSGTQGPRSR